MAEHLDRAAKGRLTGDSFRVSAPAMPGNSHIQDDSFSQSEIARPRASVDTSLLSQNTPQVQADSLLTDNNSGNGVGDKEDRPGAPDSATEDATASEQSGPKANSFQEGPSELQRSGKGFFVKLKGRETATDARMLTIMKSSSKRDFEMTGQVIPGSTALKRPTMEIGKGKKRPTVENKTIKDLKDGRGVPDSRVTNSRRSNLMGESFQSMVGISQEVLFSLAKEHEEDNPQEKSTSPRNNNHGGLDAMDEDDSTALLGAMRNGHSDDPTEADSSAPKKPGVGFAVGDSHSSFSAGTNQRRQLGRVPSKLTSVFDFKEDDAPEWRVRVLKVVESWPVTVIFVIFTVWALFGDDIRLSIAPLEADSIFVVTTYILMGAFFLELVMLSIVKPKYIFSFYFWLDIIATASLVFDLPQVNEALLSSSGEDQGEQATLARASRTSRVGTRAGRVARVVRVVRLVRMLKIYKVLSGYLARLSKKESDAIIGRPIDDDDSTIRTAESRVGVKLTELTTRRIVIGVLLMLFTMPLFGPEFYGDVDPFTSEGLYMLHSVYASSGNSTELDILTQTYIQRSLYSTGGKVTGNVIWLHVGNFTSLDETAMYNRRDTEVHRYQSDCTDAWGQPVPIDGSGSYNCTLLSKVTIDNKWMSQFEAILNMCRTVYTCIILGVGALLFSQDANTLVLHPLERMVQKVKEMSENPLAKMQIRAVATKDEQQMETRILENSITKICSLLAVGFGDAGAEVVAENIRNGGDLNPMVPGHRMMAIFGFCDIRRFTDATEVLQEEVMEFVNSIAKIVHMEVSLHGGSANKNIGDAFLLVWKLPAHLLMGTGDDLSAAAANLTQERREAVAYLADRALASFVVIQVALKRSPRLKQFCMREDIRARMGDGFRVSMGFGLHIGWAIEGAIGSEYKIDASYLSPNVNMASRLEAATKQFGCSILMSDDFAMMLSPGVRKLCRPIDVITVKGSNKPVTLYTYDISLYAIAEPDDDKFQNDNMENLSHSFLSFKSEFEENPDITESIGSSQEYRDKFDLGFKDYINGHWAQARDHLLACLNRVDPHGESFTDGPAANLLEVMGRSDFIAPRDWEGVRHLTDK